MKKFKEYLKKKKKVKCIDKQIKDIKEEIKLISALDEVKDKLINWHFII